MKREKLNTILMTGATGYLGSHLFKALAGKYEIILLKRSTSNTFRIKEFIGEVATYNIDQVDLSDVFSRHSIETIIHCATDYGRKNIDTYSILSANLILPLNLIGIGQKYNLKRFINTDTILDKGVNIYSHSKNQFKEWLKLFSNKLVCVNVALEHFYGPLDDKTKFVSFIVGKVLMEVDSIDLTPGEQKRDFIFIERGTNNAI